MSKAIVIFLAVAAMAAGAACSIDNGNDNGGECNNGAGALGEGGGGEGGSGGSTGATTGTGGGADGGEPCGGCLSDGVCVAGDELDACGNGGGACEACSFGETCDGGACVLASSICIQQLEAEGLGGACSEDEACETGEWCAVSCCDPVAHTCFSVGACIRKRVAGEHCDHVDGDRQCLSGACDAALDQCK